MVKLKPFFTYFGGKYRIAPRYPKPRWKTIIEPFAGSAGYSTRYPNREVQLYDLNPKVVGTWDYLIKVSEEEIMRLPLVFDDVRNLAIPQEAKWLIGWWLNKGNAQPCHLPGLWMRQRIRPNSFWGEVIRARTAAQLEYIRHWKVRLTSYDTLPNPSATWFIDPPYQRSGKRYTFNAVDYPHLSEWTKARQGQVVACGQEGDNWLDFKPFLDAKGTEGCRREGKSKEVIWVKP